MANAREGLTQKHDQARVNTKGTIDRHPRVASVPATISCLNRCLPNPKLLVNFIYLLKEIHNVIFGLNKSFSEF